MSWHLITAVLFSAAGLVMGETRVSFDTTAVGNPPREWLTGMTGKGQARWEVVAGDSANGKRKVLKQSGEATFAWAVVNGVRIKDGFAEVRFKPLSGKEDQAGGLVFRFQDGNNYYVVRGNALEDNVVLYKTVNGKRWSLPVKGRIFGYGVDADVPKGKWRTLRVEFKANLFTVSFNGKKLFEGEDDTFKEAGAVGLWTKADSVTLFQDFRFEGHP